MDWIILVVAGLLEVVWAVSLKKAVDARSPVWVVPTLVAMTGSVALLALSLRTIPMGTAYAVWVGVGACGAAVLGIAVFHEPAPPARLACLGLLVGSIVGLHLTGCASPRRDNGTDSTKTT